MAGKSAPYACPELSNKTGLFLLCDVACGKSRSMYDTDMNADLNLPKDCQSTQCIGSHLPDPKGDKIIDKDVTVPLGKVILNPDKKANRYHNEFVVYSVD